MITKMVPSRGDRAGTDSEGWMSRVAGETAVETEADPRPAAPSGRIPAQRGPGAHRGGRSATPASGTPASGTPASGTPASGFPAGNGSSGRHRRPAGRSGRRRAVLVGSGVTVLAAGVVAVTAALTGSRADPPQAAPDDAAQRGPAVTVPLPPPSALPTTTVAPPPPTTTTPRPAPPIDLFSTAGTLWAFSRGLAGFDPINDGDVEGGGRTPVAVASPTVPGRQAVMVVVPPGGKRSEVQPSGLSQRITAGRHLAFGLSYYLAPGFPVDTEGFQVVWQLHDGGTNTSPPVALEISGGRLWLSNVGRHVADLGPVRAGSNLVVGLDIRFARGAGTVTVVRDGRTLVSNLAPPRGTMIDAFDYLKVGVYKHQDDADPTARLYINDLRICPGGDGGTVPPACRTLVGS